MANVPYCNKEYKGINVEVNGKLMLYSPVTTAIRDMLGLF